jgi:hypothetical protein
MLAAFVESPSKCISGIGLSLSVARVSLGRVDQQLPRRQLPQIQQLPRETPRVGSYLIQSEALQKAAKLGRSKPAAR